MLPVRDFEVLRPGDIMRSLLVAAVLAGALTPSSVSSLPGDDKSEDKTKRPALSVRASPAISFSPVRVRAVAELKGGSDNDQEFYCAGVEWDWGDQTRSEESTDCEPYEEGVSQLTRRFSGQHTYMSAGRYRLQVRLKRNTKVIAAANTTITVRPGVRDYGY
jgi:hypothetical protein